MARTTLEMSVSPEVVFDVLADPRSYSYWVVGSKEIRAADEGWPAVGTSFDHSVGLGPLTVQDHTRVLEARRPHLLKLKAKARPFGTALVTLGLTPTGTGTMVTMVEDPGDLFTRLFFNPLTHRLVHARNVWSLERLRELAEGVVPMPGGILPRRNERPGARPGARPVKNPAHRG